MCKWLKAPKVQPSVCIDDNVIDMNCGRMYVCDRCSILSNRSVYFNKPRPDLFKWVGQTGLKETGAGLRVFLSSLFIMRLFCVRFCMNLKTQDTEDETTPALTIVSDCFLFYYDLCFNYVGFAACKYNKEVDVIWPNLDPVWPGHSAGSKMAAGFTVSPCLCCLLHSSEETSRTTTRNYLFSLRIILS